MPQKYKHIELAKINDLVRFLLCIHKSQKNNWIDAHKVVLHCHPSEQNRPVAFLGKLRNKKSQYNPVASP